MSRAAIERYFDAINAEHWTGFSDLWTPDAVVKAVGAPPRRGRQEITDHYMRLFRAFSEHRDVPTRLLEHGDTFTVEVRFDGVTTSGRPVTFEAVDVIDVRDGQIARLTNWYDLVLVRKLLAEPPAGGSPDASTSV